MEQNDMSGTIRLHSAADLTLAALEAIAWDGWQVRLAPELLGHVAATRKDMLAALADGREVYGVTTGMGYLAGVSLSADEQEVHQANLLRGRAVGGPPYLEPAEARAVLVVRLAGFLDGAAGGSPELCSFLADRLNDGFIPAIPSTAVGCAGEIIPLAHAFGPFIGSGDVLAAGDGRSGATQDATGALAARGVAPYRPGAKEGIALLAGAPAAVALGAARRRAARVLYQQLLVCAACAIDALRAPLSPYQPVVARLANDPIMAEVLDRLAELLGGADQDRSRSEARARPGRNPQGTPRGHEPAGAGNREPSLVQAPVSLRVIPQVLAHLARVTDRLEEDLRRGLVAVTDSPAFVDGQFVSHGGFHAVDLASDLDYLCIALAQAAELAGQHAHRLLDSRFTGLPDQLAAAPGLNAGLVVVQKRIVGILNQLRRLATPASIGLADTSLGQEDAMTFTFESAEKLRRAEALLRDVIACVLLICRQAWWLGATPVAPGLEPYAGAIEDMIEPVVRDRPLGPDIERVSRFLAAGSWP
ncbi:MAG TPA: aromatic amino acid lyase [Chloroflexota bacterium]|nr:aromatic amino acid lyase [Chloroflexota bacterium]